MSMPERVLQTFGDYAEKALEHVPLETLIAALHAADKRRIDALVDAEEAAIAAIEEITRPEHP